MSAPEVRQSAILLVGYRCTGKTTVAQLLAERLGWDWLDADQVLESRYGKSIRSIFADEGEAGFRDKESEVLADLCRGQKWVLATGGGVVLREENRRLLRASGWVAWLTADAATIFQRLQRDASTAERRPNLTVGGLVEVEQLLQAREPLYRSCADLMVDTAGRSPVEIAALIAASL